MDFQTIILLIQLLVLCYFGSVVVSVVSDIRDKVADIRDVYVFTEETDIPSSDEQDFAPGVEAMSPEDFAIQEHALEKANAFRTRIDRIKEELDAEHTEPRKGTTAEILHPDVENLPHDTIKESNKTQPTEYAL